MATDNKYDRQIRLWGSHGQKALSESHICLVNAGPTGSETLKNLVLPGVGAVTVVDPHKVTAADLGNNFFVTADSVGESRAKVVSELLVEMNPDVAGHHRDADGVALVDSDPDFYKAFNLVVATQLTEAEAIKLSTHLRSAGIPLVLARTYGLIGTVRLASAEHRVIESKPDPPLLDLRLTVPWAELEEFASSIDLSSLGQTEYIHVPYVVLLLQLRKQWMAAHDGAMPKTFAEKNEFKATITALGKAVPEVEGELTPVAVNVEEAEGMAFHSYVPYSIDYELQEVLDDPKAASLTADSSKFWFLVAALRDFVANEGAGQLPVSGALPDMTATTDWFTSLQRIYKTKAETDLAAITSRVGDLLTAAGLPRDHIDTPTLERFCKNTRDVRVYRFRSISDETTAATAATGELMTELATSEHGEQCPVRWYLALRAVDRFHAANGRLPGVSDDTLDADSTAVHALATELGKELSFEDEAVSAKHAAEMVRYGGCEPHNIAAIIGGIASQEGTKLLTEQFTPMNNTHIYNGITSASCTIEL